MKGLGHECANIRFHFRNCVTQNYNFLLKNINHVLQTFEISYHRIFENKKIKLENIHNEHEEEWRIAMIKELCHMKDYKLFNFMNIDEIKSMLFYLCTY